MMLYIIELEFAGVSKTLLVCQPENPQRRLEAAGVRITSVRQIGIAHPRVPQFEIGSVIGSVIEADPSFVVCLSLEEAASLSSQLTLRVGSHQKDRDRILAAADKKVQEGRPKL